jgi:dienelactone hydrolase
LINWKIHGKIFLINSNKMITRRNFVKSNLTAGGIGIIGPSPFLSQDCSFDPIVVSGPIPLNNMLVDYQQLNEKFGFGLKKVDICNLQSWESKSRSIFQRAKIILGEAPAETLSELNPVIVDENQRDGYKEKEVQFFSGTGDMITGFLLIPDSATALSPCPGIMALHSTGPGSKQTVGLEPKEGRCYGMELAQHGYIVLAIDVISAGKRIYPGYEAYYTNEFYKEFPHWSAMGKMIHDHQKGVDYLCSLDIVDSQRIGCIGHSLGGYNSFFLQAFEPRIKAAVSSCGLSPMGGSNSPYQFARNDWFVHFNPFCREFIRTGIVPCDMHEIMALCAPRPFFNYSARKDAVYCHSSKEERDYENWWKTVDNALNQVSKVYELTGKRGNFVRIETDGGHNFPREVRDQAYRWLDKHLG